MSSHQIFLQRCYELAEIARNEGESPVGSVIVKDGVIVGEGIEKSRQLKDITRHAEVVAILDALKKTNELSDATLYTNMEPCVICSYAIRHYKIRQVVFSNYSGELGGTNTLFNVLINADVKSWGAPPDVEYLPYEED